MMITLRFIRQVDFGKSNSALFILREQRAW